LWQIPVTLTEVLQLMNKHILARADIMLACYSKNISLYKYSHPQISSARHNICWLVNKDEQRFPHNFFVITHVSRYFYVLLFENQVSLSYPRQNVQTAES